MKGLPEQLKPQRKTETYELTCWRCHRTVQLAVSQRPYRCPHCGVLLVVEWRNLG